MALITTVGGSTSDSYVSVANSDSYFASDSHVMSLTWLALTTAQKETALRMAARQLDLLNFFGCKVTQTQALEFPRLYKTAFTATVIPTQIKYAQMEQALYIAVNSSSGGSSQRAKLKDEGVKSFSLGDLREEYSSEKSTVSPNPISNLCRASSQFLAGLIKSTSSNPTRYTLRSNIDDVSNYSPVCDCESL